MREDFVLSWGAKAWFEGRPHDQSNLMLQVPEAKPKAEPKARFRLSEAKEPCRLAAMQCVVRP